MFETYSQPRSEDDRQKLREELWESIQSNYQDLNRIKHNALSLIPAILATKISDGQLAVGITYRDVVLEAMALASTLEEEVMNIATLGADHIDS